MWFIYGNTSHQSLEYPSGTWIGPFSTEPAAREWFTIHQNEFHTAGVVELPLIIMKGLPNIF